MTYDLKKHYEKYRDKVDPLILPFIDKYPDDVLRAEREYIQTYFPENLQQVINLQNAQSSRKTTS